MKHRSRRGYVVRNKELKLTERIEYARSPIEAVLIAFIYHHEAKNNPRWRSIEHKLGWYYSHIQVEGDLVKLFGWIGKFKKGELDSFINREKAKHRKTANKRKKNGT